MNINAQRWKENTGIEWKGIKDWICGKKIRWTEYTRIHNLDSRSCCLFFAYRTARRTWWRQVTCTKKISFFTDLCNCLLYPEIRLVPAASKRVSVLVFWNFRKDSGSNGCNNICVKCWPELETVKKRIVSRPCKRIWWQIWLLDLKNRLLLFIYWQIYFQVKMEKTSFSSSAH